MKKTPRRDNLMLFFIYFFSGICLISLFWLVGYILFKGIPHVSVTFLTTPFKGEQKGVFPMIISTLYLIFISLSIAIPIGISAAIYLVEYAKGGRLVHTIEFGIQALASIPSIIYGLFGFIFFVTALGFKMSILSGALTLSIVILPIIIKTTEEALKTVPNTYKEASLALGATKISTIFKVILPCALPGIFASIILSMGRMIGETAAVYLTAGMVTRIPENVFSSGRTLAVHLYLLAKEGISFELAFATASTLLILVALLNLSAGALESFIKRKAQGEM